MKSLTFYSFLFASLGLFSACSDQPADHGDGHSSEEKPTQHLTLPDITSATEAATVYAEELAFILGETDFTPEAMGQIHISTYSLEKAVAYYVENSEGEKKELAEKIAVVVEDIHLASENNRAEDTQKAVEQLSELAKQFQD